MQKAQVSLILTCKVLPKNQYISTGLDLATYHAYPKLSCFHSMGLIVIASHKRHFLVLVETVNLQNSIYLAVGKVSDFLEILKPLELSPPSHQLRTCSDLIYNICVQHSYINMCASMMHWSKDTHPMVPQPAVGWVSPAATKQIPIKQTDSI